jgi:hypothetical protein
MPSQNDFTQAVLKAQLITAGDGNDIILSEMRGCEEDWSHALCQYRQIQGALFCLQIGDYVSNTAVYFYNVMLGIVGLKYTDGVTPDPNAQLPSGITVIVEGSVGLDLEYVDTDLVDGGGGNYYLPLINKTTNTPYPASYRPSLVTVNGVSFAFSYDSTFTPTRIYGFSDKTAPKDIIVTVVTT